MASSDPALRHAGQPFVTPASRVPPSRRTNYIERFRGQEGRQGMPHLRNVLARSRNRLSGHYTLLSFRTPPQAGNPGVQLAVVEWNEDDPPHSLSSLISGAGDRPDAEHDPPSHAIFVSDLSERLINTLGTTMHLNPETFEEHLIRSGYTATSYGDRDPSTWPTRFLPKQHVSLRWYSPVHRRDMRPRNQSEFKDLVRGGLWWSSQVEVFESPEPGNLTGRTRLEWRSHHLTPLTNIFRQEWSLSVSTMNRPPNPKANGKSDGLSDTDEDDDDDSVKEDLDIVAWEERVTFCWGQFKQRQIPIFFFDPLPRLSLGSSSEATAWRQTEETLLPFTKRLAPRGPPPARQLDNDPAGLEALKKYASSIDEACIDATSWLEHFSRVASVPDTASAAISLPLLAVFQIVHRDTVMLLEQFGRVLDQISTGTLDERMMQNQLSHWRTLLGRTQSELPALHKSLRQFFLFPYAHSDDGIEQTTVLGDSEPPSRLTTALDALQVDILGMEKRCEKAQESLRAEMSLLESKRGIEEAESVSRLTELAFVFIPMTFAAGLFSMQVRELAENPPPVYAFVIAALVAVVASYGLRLVQRSTLVGETLHKLEEQIRNDQRVVTRIIPTRKIVRWLGWKTVTGLGLSVVNSARGFRWVGQKLADNLKLVRVMCSIAALALIIAPLWTRASMDMSFKGTITVLALLSILLILFLLRSSDKDEGNILPTGLGRFWRNPSGSYVSGSVTSSSMGGSGLGSDEHDGRSGQQGPSSRVDSNV